MASMSKRDPEALPVDSVSPARSRNRVDPKKLLLSKWTAVTPQNKEKHFVVVRLIEPEPPSIRIDQIELEAVHSRRTVLLHWRGLTDGEQWRQGWV